METTCTTAASSTTGWASKKAAPLHAADAQPSLADDDGHSSQATCTLLFKDHGATIKKRFPTAPELSSHLRDEKRPDAARHRLYALQGLPLSYVQVLGAHFDIDPRLFESHACRESDDLTRRIRHNAVRGVRLFAMDYAEMWPQAGPLEDDVRAARQGDAMEGPRAFLLDHDEWPDLRLRVLLCHVTLINMRNGDGTETSLLLFDIPVRSRRRQAFLRHSRLSPLMSLEGGPWPPEMKTEVFEDGLEDQLFEIFETTWKDLDFTYEKICETITDIALRKWELFENIAYKSLDSASNRIELFQTSLMIFRRGPRMLRKHKRELNDVRAHARVEGQIAEWEALFNFGDILTIAAVSARRDPTESESLIESIYERRASNKISSRQVFSTTSQSDEQHRMAAEESIERITYLGGILLPFSISAGIFSMSGDYTPGEDKFYLFWAVSIPLVLLTIVLIYADYIRRKTFGEFAYEEDEKLDKLSTKNNLQAETEGNKRVTYKPWSLLQKPWRWLFRAGKAPTSGSLPASVEDGNVSPPAMVPTSSAGDELPQPGNNQTAQPRVPVEHRMPSSAGPAGYGDHAARSKTHERVVLSQIRMRRQLAGRRRPEDEQIGWLRAFGTLVGYDPARALRKKTEKARLD